MLLNVELQARATNRSLAAWDWQPVKNQRSSTETAGVGLCLKPSTNLTFSRLPSVPRSMVWQLSILITRPVDRLRTVATTPHHAYKVFDKSPKPGTFDSREVFRVSSCLFFSFSPFRFVRFAWYIRMLILCSPRCYPTTIISIFYAISAAPQIKETLTISFWFLIDLPNHLNQIIRIRFNNTYDLCKIIESSI